MTIGRPKGKNVVPVPLTMPKSLVEALRKLRVTEGLGVSTMITIAVSEWLKGKNIKLEVRF